ncbi:LytTR family two component transcriptional regulator [Pontibacter ummariensis]|uniref:Two component transcriptional regulator, LytTR family n=1 Tax=Pontibacter ummariensis TaxID=1610492 RepID=A0A239DB75_9BACT|nr:LytTR family DNA-binding domain-containing protein [Pontibacter ummariensis]PRY14320.1 LytTR family two component transcriptional regulator [Pontibacter ummariensis]SNS29101.1 two component transcriptional regulator, LytTR family [Pontibacter ummariensis]
MNIFIVEDEAIAVERIQEMVRKVAPEANISGLADSIEESVQYLKEQPMPDLILMDIELVDGQSFEIFREVEITCPVIFTTAYDEFALQAFKVHSVDYLLKPIQLEDLQQSVDKFRQLKQVYGQKQALQVDELLLELRKSVAPASNLYREHFLVRQGQHLISISVEDIAYFYSEERITFLKTREGRSLALDYPLEEVEKQLDPKRFFRASRKYLIERRSIRQVYVHFNGKYKAELQPATKDELLVSRDRGPEFKKWLGA